MTEKDTTILKQYTNPLSRSIQEQYAISPDHYRGDIKLGLRNNDGTGVLVGVSKVGSVQGYLMQDGQRVPAPGKLYYRGIELTDIVEAHRKAGTFGFEEVAYLLLMGYLPSKSELAYFDKIMNQARKLPEGFTEGMIMRHPSHNIMNELARSVLSLYSYDPDPDNTSIDNMLLQSVKLVGYFPSIVANAYAVQRHYFHGDSLHIHFPVPELSTAENFLRMMRPDKSYTDEEAHLLDMMLMVHAEHGGGNNSTFVCRAMSSSGTDTYSAIAGAVGSLKGPLHGGANAKVMEMFRYIKENVDPHDDGSIKDYLNKLLDGQAGDRSGKIYGLGHAVYTMSDPRACPWSWNASTATRPCVPMWICTPVWCMPCWASLRRCSRRCSPPPVLPAGAPTALRRWSPATGSCARPTVPSPPMRRISPWTSAASICTCPRRTDTRKEPSPWGTALFYRTRFSSVISPLQTTLVGPVRYRSVTRPAAFRSASTYSVPPVMSTRTCLPETFPSSVSTVTTEPVPVPQA